MKQVIGRLEYEAKSAKAREDGIRAEIVALEKTIIERQAELVQAVILTNELNGAVDILKANGGAK